ncbi:conserved hypothetical protein [Abyssogena phaseoliformis symbiont OG214]|uniref:YgaP family membrane protein n=1 Tax=Abyssogena phaseoliformis symbiont TaxID=596095 RepID=UPI001915E851|nr:DUF2892 domain-containing protein [Abyssogena phaseoliformis symbiont]MBW5288941.1 Permeases of the major facilitator superfamily [Candidatus Ruthia sp. Apha_13_S6]BBB22809.1 conserved hypothetical protein [Abyssogena phaseoliformis symbiont OG214]
MKQNVGSIDKILRIIAGIALIIYALYSGALWAWIGIIPLLTGSMGWCPLYPVFGCSSCKK